VHCQPGGATTVSAKPARQDQRVQSGQEIALLVPSEMIRLHPLDADEAVPS